MYVFYRDICNSLRIVETVFPFPSTSAVDYSTSSTLTESEGMEIYRELYKQSGPVLQLLQALLMVLSRSAAEHRASHSTAYPVQACTFLLVYPVLRGILLLPHTMPGTEHTFHLLDRLIDV